MFLYAIVIIGGWGPLNNFRLRVGIQTDLVIIRGLEPLGKREVLEKYVITHGQWFDQLCLQSVQRRMQ